ncbi:MAG TPA: S-layer homology domain-containing protein [Myxococcota bacterium]|nr:S-layer homology domain-containing protein [Myxococcota bacterium]
MSAGSRRGMVLVGVLAMVAGAGIGRAQFSYEPAGQLVSGSGSGLASTTVHSPEMRFPLESGPAYANSQVWGAGGLYGPGGGQCAASNYRYPWRDNFCETRTHTMPLCPAGQGHQGQDIRPATCADNAHWAVAAEAGTITHVGSYSVYLQGRSGITYRYLHMNSASVAVRAGQVVGRGQRLGRVSDNFGGTATTIHLHFDMKRYLTGYGNVYVPPYMSLVRAYERLIGTPAVEQNPAVELCEPEPVAGAAGELFKDMPPGALGKVHAEALFRADITSGCSQSPRFFCPDCKVKRWMMAVFLVRAKGLSVANPPANSSFSDVPKTVWYWPYVEAAKAAGITRGCNEAGTLFCPDDDVSRGQAAVFLANTLGWPLVNPATASFSDVPKTAWNYRQIETLKALCVTTGCGGDRFCPDESLTRAQAAVFIAKSFDLEDLNGCVAWCDAASCDDGSFCEEWGECGAFDSVCDESGRQTRTCVDAACVGSATNATCTTSAAEESRGCSRDTDGVEAVSWGTWSECGGFEDACDRTGVATRTRSVCRGGVAVVESATAACTREVVCGDVGPDVGEADARSDGGESDAVMPETHESDAVISETHEPDAVVSDVVVADTQADTGPSADTGGTADTRDGYVADTSLMVELAEVSTAGGGARRSEGCSQGAIHGLWGLLGLLILRRR